MNNAMILSLVLAGYVVEWIVIVQVAAVFDRRAARKEIPLLLRSGVAVSEEAMTVIAQQWEQQRKTWPPQPRDARKQDELQRILKALNVHE